MAELFITRPRYDENEDPKKSNEDDDDDDEDVIEHVTLNGTFKELAQHDPNFDFMAFVLYYPPDNRGNEANTLEACDDHRMDDAGAENDDEEEDDEDEDDNDNLPGRKYVWTGPDCCCRDETFVPLPPSKSHTYKLDLIVVSCTVNETSDGRKEDEQKESNTLERKIQITGPDERSVASTVAGILCLLFSISSSESNVSSNTLSVTFQAFATNPRLPFPSILYDDIYINENISSTKKNIMIPKLCLAFLGINDPSTIRALTYGFDQLELRQCTTTSHDADAGNDPTIELYSNVLFGSQVSSLIMSCAQPEFMKFATQWSNAAIYNTSSSSRLHFMHLKLHFWLQGPSMTCFCNALESCKPPLEKLVVEYLDIVDDAWYGLFKAISKTTTLKSIKLCFTDNFVDNYRRMTPERRTARTQAVLNSLHSQTSLEEILWPAFQQDEALMPQIQLSLQNNAMNKMSIYR